jgi:hypothetical protein
MRRVGLILLLLATLSLSGCSYWQTLQDSSQFREFCRWAPVAISGIGQAVIESSNDPAKHNVTAAMSQALVFLKLAAAQCPTIEGR